MLTLEKPALEIDGVLLYADHAVPTHFYHAAPNPAVARVDNRPMFDLYLYTVPLEHSVLAGTRIPDELGAGFLNMGVECVLPANRLQRVREQLAAQTGLTATAITLSPIPYTRGSVRVIALDAMQDLGGEPGGANSAERLDNRPKFVEQIVGAATPSLLGNLRSIFSLRLSQNGAAFLEGLYSQNAAPVGVVYELEFDGLRPAIEVAIHANLSRIHTHFGGGISGQYSWFKADISAGIDYLTEKGDILIQITSQMSGSQAETSKKLALDLFRERIVQEMFRPSLPARANRPDSGLTDLATSAVSTGMAAATGGAAGGSLTLTLKAEMRHEDKLITYRFNERMPEKRTHAPQAFLPLLLDRATLQQRIFRVDLDNRFFQTVSVLATGPTAEEFATLGIRQVSADFSYADVRQTLLFRPDSSGDKTFAAKRNNRDSLAWNVALTYDFHPGHAIRSDSLQYHLPARTRTGQSFLINPRRDFGLLAVEIEAGRIPASVRQIDVALHYAAPDGSFAADETFRIPLPQATRPVWRVRTAGLIEPRYTAQVTWLFDDGTVWEGPPQEESSPLLRIDAPFRHERVLLIRPNVLSPTISEVALEIGYSDPAHRYERRFLVTLRPPFGSSELRWPILDPAVRTIRYRETTFEPGFTNQGEWQDWEDDSLIVGAANSRAVQVTVRLIGDSLEAAGIDALLVILQQTDAGSQAARHDLFFAPGDPLQQVAGFTIPPGNTLRYTWQTQTFKRDGSMTLSDPVSAETPLLIISTRTL